MIFEGVQILTYYPRHLFTRKRNLDILCKRYCEQNPMMRTQIRLGIFDLTLFTKQTNERFWQQIPVNSLGDLNIKPAQSPMRMPPMRMSPMRVSPKILSPKRLSKRIGYHFQNLPGSQSWTQKYSGKWVNRDKTKFTTKQRKLGFFNEKKNFFLYSPKI